MISDLLIAEKVILEPNNNSGDSTKTEGSRQRSYTTVVNILSLDNEPKDNVFIKKKEA